MSGLAAGARGALNGVVLSFRSATMHRSYHNASYGHMVYMITVVTIAAIVITLIPNNYYRVLAFLFLLSTRIRCCS